MHTLKHITYIHILRIIYMYTCIDVHIPCFRCRSGVPPVTFYTSVPKDPPLRSEWIWGPCPEKPPNLHTGPSGTVPKLERWKIWKLLGIFMDFHGFSWMFMDFHGFSWIFMDFDGF